MIRVTIEEFDDKGRVTRSVMRSSLGADTDADDEPPSYGEVISMAIRDFRLARIDAVIAAIIHDAEFVNMEFFVGRSEAMTDLTNAADIITSGWEKFDERVKR